MIPDNIEKIILTKEDYDRNVEQMVLERNEYLDRIDKAIEYMRSIENEPDADMYMELGKYNEYKYLLKILKGEDKE